MAVWTGRRTDRRTDRLTDTLTDRHNSVRQMNVLKDGQTDERENVGTDRQYLSKSIFSKNFKKTFKMNLEIFRICR
jgi:hypothetical protein